MSTKREHFPENTNTTLLDRTKIKSQKTTTFDPLILSRVSYAFTMPDTLTTLLALSSKPWNLGITIGKLLYHILPLVSMHLDNPIDFATPVPRALTDMPAFVASVDDYVAHLRLTDVCSKKFPTSTSESSSDARKVMKSQRKYVDRFTYLTEVNFRSYVAEYLGDVFRKWRKEETQAFNKGMDKAASGVQWVVYPDRNVVFEARWGDWGGWLRNECEVLGMKEVKMGRRALEEMQVGVIC